MQAGGHAFAGMGGALLLEPPDISRQAGPRDPPPTRHTQARFGVPSTHPTDAQPTRPGPAARAPRLHPPWQPLCRFVAAHVAGPAPGLPFVFPVWGGIALVRRAARWLPSPSRLLLGVLATWLAFAVNFLLQSLITMACFWTERASALDRLLFIP